MTSSHVLPGPRARASRWGIEALTAVVALLALLAVPNSARAEGDCPLGRFAAADESGIGGTGLAGDESGIGGTGFGGDEGGIGGTGLLGTITDLGSICVNGLAVHYGPEVRVTANGKTLSPRRLGVGQVVWIVASKSQGRLLAESITLVTELAGKVGAVDLPKRTFEIGGESIDVLEDAVVFGIRGGPLRIEPGFWVAVSGLRRPSGRIAASRIDPSWSGARPTPLRIADRLRELPALRWLSIEGYVGEQQAGERFGLAGLEVDASKSRGAVGEAGESVWVRGELDGSLLRADRIVPRPVDLIPGGGGLLLPGAGAPTREREADPAGEPDVAKQPVREPELPGIRTADPFDIGDHPIKPEIPAVPDAPIDPGPIDVFDPGRVR